MRVITAPPGPLERLLVERGMQFDDDAASHLVDVALAHYESGAYLGPSLRWWLEARARAELSYDGTLESVDEPAAFIDYVTSMMLRHCQPICGITPEVATLSRMDLTSVYDVFDGMVSEEAGGA